MLGLPEMLTAFVILYILLISFAVYTLGKLREIRMLHTTFLVFFIGIMFRTISLAVQTLNWWLLVISDQKPPALDMIGANFIFICNALSIAFGYTIVCGQFNFEVCNIYGGFILVYIVGSGALGVLDSWTTDADRFFVYEADAGLGFLMLRLFGWYLVLPLTVLMVKGTIVDYGRARIVYVVELLLDLFASVAILIFVQPRDWNKYFPYHLPVNRVDIVTFDEAIRFPPPPGFQAFRHRALAGARGRGASRESIRRQMSTTTHLDDSEGG
ncbi:unnamed protein product [Schistocephalus solidus]|uniref:GpcrRhopsn4 domain-containing protein n=1 Tax=Schistocephalus solidus TaxID=70667 RepID=A0A183T4D3_SCHSO|nr:unnamed protein product [Schistocephalus solidus]